MVGYAATVATAMDKVVLDGIFAFSQTPMVLSMGAEVVLAVPEVVNTLSTTMSLGPAKRGQYLLTTPVL
jgi:hypothetical protein